MEILLKLLQFFDLLLIISAYLGSFATATCRNCGLKVDSEAIREDIDSGVLLNRVSLFPYFFLKNEKKKKHLKC